MLVIGFCAFVVKWILIINLRSSGRSNLFLCITDFSKCIYSVSSDTYQTNCIYWCALSSAFFGRLLGWYIINLSLSLRYLILQLSGAYVSVNTSVSVTSADIRYLKIFSSNDASHIFQVCQIIRYTRSQSRITNNICHTALWLMTNVCARLIASNLH